MEIGGADEADDYSNDLILEERRIHVIIFDERVPILWLEGDGRRGRRW